MPKQATTDIWFTAYLLFKGHEIKEYQVIKRGKGQYNFEIENEEWRKLKLEFSKSEFCSCKELIAKIKDLTY